MSELKYRYFVTALIGIGIFCLLGWLLTLWKPANSGEVASWVQAMGGIVAVGMAAAIPFVHSRHIELRRVDAMSVALRDVTAGCAKLTLDLQNAFSSNEAMTEYDTNVSLQEWKEVIALLDNFPVWNAFDVPAAKTVPNLREAMKTGLRLHEEIPIYPHSFEWEETKLTALACHVTVEACASVHS